MRPVGEKKNLFWEEWLEKEKLRQHNYINQENERDISRTLYWQYQRQKIAQDWNCFLNVDLETFWVLFQ